MLYRYRGKAQLGAGLRLRAFVADFNPAYGWDYAGLVNVEFVYWREIPEGEKE